MSATVQLVFRGEVLAGFRAEDVQRELGRLLRADETQLKALFSGRRAVLKRGLAAEDAARYVGRLATIGAQVHVEPEAAPAGGWPTIAPPPDDAAPIAPAPPTRAVVPAAPKELALVPAAVPVGEQADEVTCPKCGERQSMRLLCRGCTTNLEMAFAAQREEEEQRRAERQAALEARRSGRARGGPVVDDGVRSAWPIGFGFSGRVGRLAGATANLWLIAAMVLLTAGFLQRPSLPRMLLLGIGALAVFFFSMRLTVLRCHDCGRHGWWSLFVLVPYAGSLASLLFSLLPGDPDVNEYGPPPPKARWLWFGVAVAALAVVGVLAVRSALILVERQAESAQEGKDDDQLIDLGGSTSVGGGSNASGPQDAWRDYIQAPGHKAFAASSRQNYAWVGNAGSPDEAARQALSQCEAHRPAYTPGCRVVSVNGQSVNN